MIVTEMTIEDIRNRLVALTRDLILIPSIPSRTEDLKRCYEFIKNHLESLENIEVREFEDKGVPSLIAAPPDCLSPDILLCGHLDVITHPDVSVYRSHIDNGRIYGPGAGDMKGALAILLEVFREIHTRLPNASLGIAVTADEESGGESGIGFLFHEAGIRCKEAMIPDGGSLNQIAVEEKGILHMRVICQGHSAHAARPWLGDNPIERLMDELKSLREFFSKMEKGDDHWVPTCAVTIIETENQTFNRIPTEAQATLDIRFPKPFTVKKIFDQIRKIVSSDLELEIIISAEPSHLSPDPLYQKITEEITGKKTVTTRDDGGSDARFIAHYGIPVVMSRPLVGNLHAQDEWIDIESMVQLYQIYHKFLLTKMA